MITEDRTFVSDVVEIYNSFSGVCVSTEEDKHKKIEKILQLIGEKGYIAVDINNQINMTNCDIAECFLEAVDSGQAAKCSILNILYNDSFVKFDFNFDKINVFVCRTYFIWDGEGLIEKQKEEYKAISWKYTGNYLFFERYRDGGFDGDSPYTVFRVKPMDDDNREYTEKYMLCVGYDSNNLFITEWNKDNLKALNYYDLFEYFYKMKYGTNSPYGEDGVTYLIDEDIFEGVIKEFIDVSSDVLKEVCIYDEKQKKYQYRIRGMFDYGTTPLVPYPEVVEIKNNADGTITLKVNAVSIKDENDKLFMHKVTIKKKASGGFQYISNEMLTMNKEGAYWYRDRLSDEEWVKHYGDR